MTTNFVKRLFPFLGWPRINRATIGRDLMAGVAVSLLVIPQSLAYAQLAGVPAYYGLYAAFLPSIVAVLFGSSGILSTGPVALTSLLTAASVGHLAAPGSDQFVSYVILLALLSGIFQIGFGLARAGVILNLLPHPVLMGFVNAAALIIVMSQLPTLTGIVAPTTENILVGTGKMFARIETLHALSLALGSVGIALLYVFKRFTPRLPGVLFMVAILTLLSYATDFAGHGGMVVGDIPSGIPSISVPKMSWEAILLLIPAAFIIALFSFMEVMSSSKVIAIKTRTRWDENQELIGQGLAKVAAAFCQSMPVSGSFSRSALNLASHASTGFSSLFAAGFVLLTLLFFTPVLYHLPKPALAAMIILAVANLINFSTMRHAWHANKNDGIASVLTFVATLVFAPNIQFGIMAGIIFALGAFIYGRMTPGIVMVGAHADGTLLDADFYKLNPPHEKIGALRFDAALFFANASFFEDAILKVERDNPKLEYILVVASGINYLDASAVEMLRGLVVHLRECGIALVFSGAKRQFLDVAERTGLTREIGPENIFGSDQLALRALMTRIESQSVQS